VAVEQSCRKPEKRLRIQADLRPKPLEGCQEVCPMTLGLELTRVAGRIQNEQQESAQTHRRSHRTPHHPRGWLLFLRRLLQDLLTEAASVVQVHGQQSSLER